jgi:flagellin-specific chaperone FliS
MYIASQKRKENIAEYLLYMWQIEDIIRANNLDIDKIRATVIDGYNLPDDKKHELEEWYESLIDMMRREGVEKKGHLQLNKNTIIQLTDLHRQLMADEKFVEYQSEFYNTLPYIVELRSRQGEEKLGEVETCFAALYGMLLMRLQGKEITKETSAAIAQITRLVARLAGYFKLDQEDKLFNTDDK